MFKFGIAVLTSDAIRFALACKTAAESIDEANEKIIDTYRRAYSVFNKCPSLLISYLSANRAISRDKYLRQLDEASGGVPAYGIVNSGENDSGTNIYILLQYHIKYHIRNTCCLL